MAVISLDDYFFFVDDALDGMIRIVTDLGDELANRRPDLPGANSPYVLLHHCLGVIEYWAGYMVAGRDIERDRDAEFRAAGSVRELVDRARSAQVQLRRDVSELDPLAPPRGIPAPEDEAYPPARSQGGVLIHVYEELAQHRGQMEGIRDVLLAPWAHLA